MKRIVEEKTDMKVFTGTQEECIILLNWYQHLLDIGDLDKILFPSCYTIGSFMSFFCSSKVKLVYVLDSNNQIQTAVWGEAITHGVIWFSLWVKSNIRHTRKGLQIVLDIYHEVFNHFYVIIGITKQEKILSTHKKFGYKIISKVPNLWGGIEDGWLVMLTKDDFLSALEV